MLVPPYGLTWTTALCVPTTKTEVPCMAINAQPLLCTASPCNATLLSETVSTFPDLCLTDGRCPLGWTCHVRVTTAFALQVNCTQGRQKHACQGGDVPRGRPPFIPVVGGLKRGFPFCRPPRPSLWCIDCLVRAKDPARNVATDSRERTAPRTSTNALPRTHASRRASASTRSATAIARRVPR